MTKVKKINPEQPAVHNKRITKEDLINDFNFHMMRKVCNEMLEEKLITNQEYKELMNSNCLRYKPYLLELYK